MPGTPYLFERQSEYWTSRSVEDFYIDKGFEVIAFPLTQLAERKLPADFLFYHKHLCKVFGFQYKALYHNSEDYWPIDERQHKTLSKFPWVYYCLSEMKNAREQKTALHYVRIYKPKFEFREKIFPRTADNPNIESYYRWGAFYQSLEKCDVGVRVQSEGHLKDILLTDSHDTHFKSLSESLVDVFLADYESKRAIHLSPFIPNILQEPQ